MNIWHTANVSKHLLVATFAIILATPAQTQADQIAQGQVEVTIAAYSYVAITTATCSLDLNTFDNKSVVSYYTSDSVAATVQGGTVTCVVTTPYYWSVASLDGTINIGYSVSAQNTSTSVEKSTSGNFVAIPLSTTGTTTRNVVTRF
jgi:hypothetical protein